MKKFSIKISVNNSSFCCYSRAFQNLVSKTHIFGLRKWTLQKTMEALPLHFTAIVGHFVIWIHKTLVSGLFLQGGSGYDVLWFIFLTALMRCRCADFSQSSPSLAGIIWGLVMPCPDGDFHVTPRRTSFHGMETNESPLVGRGKKSARGRCTWCKQPEQLIFFLSTKSDC